MSFLVPRRSVRMRPSELGLCLFIPRYARRIRRSHTPARRNNSFRRNWRLGVHLPLPQFSRHRATAISHSRPQPHRRSCADVVRAPFRVSCEHGPGSLLRRHVDRRHHCCAHRVAEPAPQRVRRHGSGYGGGRAALQRVGQDSSCRNFGSTSWIFRRHFEWMGGASRASDA